MFLINFQLYFQFAKTLLPKVDFFAKMELIFAQLIIRNNLELNVLFVTSMLRAKLSPHLAIPTTRNVSLAHDAGESFRPVI